MTANEVRWGILGTARIAEKAVAPAIRKSHSGKLQGVASRSHDKATAFAANLGIERSYSSYQDLLNDAEIDAVYVPLPNNLHKPWTIKAAEAGKHVLCEKPLALSSGDCLEMQTAAQKNGVKLMEAFMYRFHPRIEGISKLVQQGKLGEVSLLRSSFTFAVKGAGNIRLRPELGGGALMDVGCYCVNIGRTLMGAEPVQVQAFASWTDSGVDGLLLGTMTFKSRAFVQFDCSLELPRREQCEIVGSKGRLDIPSAFVAGTGPVVAHWLPTDAAPEDLAFPAADSYQLMVEHFESCILHDTPLRYPVEDAAANMRVIESLYRSAREGGLPVAVEPQ